MIGLLSGVLVTGLSLPTFRTLYDMTPLGAFTLPQLLGLPYGVVVALVSALAVGLIAFIGRFEARA